MKGWDVPKSSSVSLIYHSIYLVLETATTANRVTAKQSPQKNGECRSYCCFKVEALRLHRFFCRVLKHVFVSDVVFFHYCNTFKSVSLNIKSSSENNNDLKTMRQQTGVKQISSSSRSFMPLTACHCYLCGLAKEFCIIYIFLYKYKRYFFLEKRLKNVEILVNFLQKTKTRAHLKWVLSLLTMPSGYHHQKYHQQLINSHELPDTQQAGPKFKWPPANSLIITIFFQQYVSSRIEKLNDLIFVSVHLALKHEWISNY